MGTVANALNSGIIHDISIQSPERTAKQLVVAVQNDLAFEYAFVMDSDTVFAHSFPNDVPEYIKARTVSDDKIEPQVIELDQPSGLLHHYRFPLDTKGRSLHIGANQKEINALMKATATDIAIALIPVTLLGLYLGLLLSRNLNQELSEISKVMVQYGASGDLLKPAPTSSNYEIAEVIRQVETLAAKQNATIKDSHPG